MVAGTTVGLVGVGHWGRGRHILRDLVTIGCEVHAVARSEESIGRAEEHGAASIVDHLDALPELDGCSTRRIARLEDSGGFPSEGVVEFPVPPETAIQAQYPTARISTPA